jgi:CDP-glycerol glycerophosphotransferase (TagB/SpsB family)
MASPDSSSAPLRRVVDLTLDAVIVAVALLGVLVLLDGSRWGLLWLALGLLGTVAQLVQTRLARGPGWSPLGRAQVMRALVLSGTAVALGTTSTSTRSQVLGAGLGAAVLVGSLVAEPFVARAVRFQVPVAAGLPGLPPPPAPRDLGPQAVLASCVAAGLGLLLAWSQASAWWWLLAGLVAVTPVAVLTVTGRAKILFARRVRAQVPLAVAEYAPEFVVYTARPDDASYQVLMWLPYLQRAGLRFLVVTRNGVPARALAALTDVPVVEARGMANVEALMVPSLKAAFYVNASSGNGALVRFQHLTHVYLGHGDSDKPPSYNPTHAMYDQIFAAGPAATRRYAAHGVRIPEEKFRIVGRPQVEGVAQVTRAIGTVDEPVLLYAPTWRGHVEETMFSSLLSGEQIVAALLGRGATVIFRPHPFSYDFPEDAAAIRRIQAQLEADARRTGRKHLWGAAAESERSILDCINASDAMVSDVSSVVSDYLFSGKPFAMVAVPSDPETFVEDFPAAAAAYVVRGDLADLEARLTEMLGVDPRQQRRLELRADYLGDFPAERYADVFVRAVQDVSRRQADAVDQEEDDPDAAEQVAADGDLADGAEEDRPSIAEAPEPAVDADLEPAAATDEDGEEGEGDLEEESAPRRRGLSRYRRVFRRVGLDLAGTALALVALLVALLGAPAWSVALFGVLAVWAALQSVARTVRRRSRRSRLLTEGDGTRAVLLVALAALLVGEGVSSWPTWAAVLVLGVVTVAERRIRSAWGRFGLIAVNLPSALQPVRQRVARGWLPLAGFAALVVGFVVAVLVELGVLTAQQASTALAVTALLVAVLFVVVLQGAFRRAAAVERGERRLRDALVEHAPEFAVYFASTVGAGYQVGMWLPYFLRIGRPFVIVTRSVPMLRQIQRLCQAQDVVVPVLHRPTLRSLEEVIVPTMSAAFYVNNAVRNTHFIERRELTHVWLNHGDSEKPACYNPVHAIYDLIFAAGQAGIDRYARHGVHIPAEKFRVVGRPQVEQIEPARGPVAAQQPPTVLYAPTWQGPYADSRVYSLPQGAEIVAALLRRGARVVFRAHPFNYRYASCRALISEIGALLEADRERTGREHLWGRAAERELTVEDCFNLSDAMISDVSAVVSDYLHSGKPFAMVSVGRTPDQLAEEAPAATAAYVLREDLSNLEQVLDDLLVTDPRARTRDRTRVYYLGDFAHDRYADGFLDAARTVIDTSTAPVPATTE